MSRSCGRAACAGTTPLLAGAIDDRSRVQIDAPDRTRLRFSKDLGPVDHTKALDHLQIVLRRQADAEAAFFRLLRTQRDPASPAFHQWLPPDTVGAEYGPRDADMRILSQWLEAHGLHVNTVARSLMSIDVSATASSLRSGFGADMHKLRHGPELHLPNVAPISIPAAPSPLVVGVIGLDDFYAGSYMTPLHAQPAPAFAPRSARAHPAPDGPPPLIRSRRVRVARAGRPATLAP